MNIIKDKSLEPYEIQMDEQNYIVQTDTGRIDKRSGRAVKNVIGYHSTLKSAIMRIIRLKSVHTGGDVTLNEFLEHVEGVTKPIIDRLSI